MRQASTAEQPWPELVRRVVSGRTHDAGDDPSLIPAGVLLLLLDRGEGPALLLTKRSQEVEYHKGEVCFVGGAQDPDDGSLLSTALREAWEEMGVDPTHVEVLGRLDPVRPTVSPFVIYPFVGLLPHPYPFRPSAAEIADVLEIPLAALHDPANQRMEERLRDGRVDHEVSYAYGRHLVFGATARILGQFLALLRTEAAGGGAASVAR